MNDLTVLMYICIGMSILAFAGMVTCLVLAWRQAKKLSRLLDDPEVAKDVANGAAAVVGFIANVIKQKGEFAVTLGGKRLRLTDHSVELEDVDPGQKQ